MTTERLKEARTQACYHVNLARLMHDNTIIWSEVWMCLDCPAVFEVQSIPQIEEKEAVA